MKNRKTPASRIALGGVLAALAVVIMSIGTLIPAATYVCPLLCAIGLQIVLNTCGSRIAWAWYGAVAILSLLMAPDKEAAGVFLFLGYYPIVKPWMDRRRLPVFWKLALFNTSTVLLYFLLLKIMGLPELTAEFSEMGKIMLALLLLMGNVAFFMMDNLLGMEKFRRKI